jgi:hypothetical protein
MAKLEAGKMPPELWVDGVDHTDTWVGCLESSGYTHPTAPDQPDPAEEAKWAQRSARVANDWIACARENGLPSLPDADPNSEGPYAPHAEIPLATDPTLLKSVVEACPTFNEEALKRQMEGDPTLQDDIEADRVNPSPLLLVEEPAGLQEDGFDFQSEEGKRFSELGSILVADQNAFTSSYMAELKEKGLVDENGNPL